MKDLLSWVRSNVIKERPEMFIKGDTVYVSASFISSIFEGLMMNVLLTWKRRFLCRRPGVLVLVNDCDWELSGQLETTIEEKDVIVFISTLHGG
ncbi:unnamed protein product [Eruca vesicaria subsp. sativa]|uniref:Ubiquitin-related modifier 1 n=1 Tax=Eruca vesicaria subsp. sativa TaxID=29727 RepID=A0ABC8LJA7_ERUVS|nr:unnamed protein product [Eruca vesicaria subsp. sativa]